MRKLLRSGRRGHPGQGHDSPRAVGAAEPQSPRIREYFYSASPIRRRRTLAGGVVVAVALAALVNSMVVGGTSGATVNFSAVGSTSGTRPPSQLSWYRVATPAIGWRRHPKAPTTTTTIKARTTTTQAPTTTTTGAPTTTTTQAPTTITTAVPPTTTTTQAPPTTTTTQAPPTGLPGPNAYPGFTQVLADDFNGTSLNQTTWNGFYTDLSQNWLGSHGTVADSMITMSEYRDSANGGAYTGTGLSTRTGWTSGMAFVRARADAGAGVTMCIGMIGLDTWPPEIDFYEDWPSTNTRQSFTDSIVWGAPATWESTVTREVNTSVDATQWHTYGVKWNPTTITLLVDGVAWATIPNPSPTGAHGFDEPMKLFMQIETGDVGAEPTSITPAVVNMNVDWAVVYTPS